MPTTIHSTAVVSPKAELHDGVEVGPYAVIGPHVVLGAEVKVRAQVVIDGHTTVDENTQIFPKAVIGLRPQDLKYHGEKSYVKIGRNNTIREFVTINSSTGENTSTVIGNDCLLMAYTHIAHNCRIGNEVLMANLASLSGHSIIEDRAMLSGLVGVHQYVNIGTMSITGGASKVNQDVPPYALSDGNPCKVRDINSVGLKRHGVDSETRMIIRRAFKILFRAGLNMKNAIRRVQDEIPPIPQVLHLIEFIQNSKRGIGR
jgi:UDP-N-acetylglucosamine acyltransferase